MHNQSGKLITHRVITMLNRDELEFLDKLGKDSLFTTGHKLTYTEILEGLVKLAIDTGLSGEKIGSKEEMEEKLYGLIKEKMKEVEKGQNKNGGSNEEVE